MPVSSQSSTLFRRALVFVRPERGRILVVLALAILVAALGAAEPLLAKRIFDELAGGELTPAIGWSLGAIVALELARSAFGGILGVVTWDVRLAVDFCIRERLVGKLNALPLSYHQHESVGATMTRLNQGVSGFIAAFAELAFNVLPAVAFLGLAVAAMLQLDWRLCLLVVVFAPLPAIIGMWAAREQTERERALMQRWTDIYSRLNEVLSGIRMVKAFNMEETEQRRFLDGQREGNALVRRGVRTDAWTGALRSLAATAARLVALGAGAVLVVRGEVTIGTLVAFLGYIGALFAPVQGLTNVYQAMRKGTVSLEIIFGILDADDEVADVDGAGDLAHVLGDVTFDQVDFAYRLDAPVLSAFSLHVRAGETIAFVGPSGSGKTTLALLLQRLFPVHDGSIRIDGVDLRSVNRRSIRREIGVVFQDVHLFNDTVRANIAYGCAGASDAEVEAAARAANAHEFIATMPEGYDTLVGERGGFLSGGQRQRIGIARVFLQNPRVLVLDEATSALDAEAEAQVQEALRTIARGRTTFIIAHRLSTVVDAHRIVVLRDGAIEAVGTHDQLLRESAYYASLVHRQSGGLLRAA
jgi:ATP-binding cassette subfamily B protein